MTRFFMATYKGIGFDGTSGKIRTATSSDSVQFNAEIDAQDGVLATGGVSTDTLTTTGDASVGGNLTVTGDIVSRGQVNLVVQDPMIDLGLGNDDTNPISGGYSLTMNRASGFTAETVTACTAGVSATSAPTLTTSASSNFSAGDVLCLTGSSDGSNDGLFIVANASGTTITLEGVGGTAISGNTPFAQNQVTTTTGDNASAYKVDLYVQVVADFVNFPDSGGTAYAKGSLIEIYQSNAVKSDFTGNGAYALVGSSASSLSLQDVYGNGNSITTSGSSDIDFNLASGNFTIDQGNMTLGATSATNFTMDGGSFSAGSTTALSIFGVTTNGNNGGDIVLSESGASGSVQLEVNSGTVLEAKSGLLDVNTDVDFGKASGSEQLLKRLSTADGDDLKIALTGANDASLILQSAGTGGDALLLNATAGAFQLQGNGSVGSKVNVTGQDLSLTTTTNGDIVINSAQGIDMDATGGINVDGVGISIDGTGASNLTTTSANLTVSTVTSGTLAITSAGALDIDGQATTLDATTLSIDSTDTTNFTMTANDAGNKTLTVASLNNGAGQGNLALNGGNNIFCQIAGTPVLEIAPASIIASQNLQASSTGGLKFGLSGQVVTEIDTDDTFASATDSALATQLAIKTYVDGQIPTVDQDLDFAGDTGTGTVNLATQSLDIAGGSNITTTASGQTNTVALDADITLTSVTATTLATTNLKANDGTASATIANGTGALTVSSSLTLASGSTVSAILDQDGMDDDSDTALATQQSIKAYVDSTVQAYQGFTVLTDGSSGALSAGDVVAINGSGQAIQADADSASTANVIGICTNVDGSTIYVQQIGNNQSVSGLTAGTKYYLSTTAGGLTATAPSGTGDVVYQIGYARSSTELIVAPQFIMEIG
jgi:hypothetical protein